MSVSSGLAFVIARLRECDWAKARLIGGSYAALKGRSSTVAHRLRASGRLCHTT